MIQLSDDGRSKSIKMERKVHVVKNVQGTRLTGPDWMDSVWATRWDYSLDTNFVATYRRTHENCIYLKVLIVWDLLSPDSWYILLHISLNIRSTTVISCMGCFFPISKATEIFACERRFHILFLSVFEYCCGTGFLKLSKTDILGKISLCCAGLSCVLCDA